jgi:hypothetical protein
MRQFLETGVCLLLVLPHRKAEPSEQQEENGWYPHAGKKAKYHCQKRENCDTSAHGFCILPPGIADALTQYWCWTAGLTRLMKSDPWGAHHWPNSLFCPLRIFQNVAHQADGLFLAGLGLFAGENLGYIGRVP